MESPALPAHLLLMEFLVSLVCSQLMESPAQLVHLLLARAGVQYLAECCYAPVPVHCLRSWVDLNFVGALSCLPNLYLSPGEMSLVEDQ